MNIKTALQSLIFLSIVAFVYLFIKSTFLKEQKDIVDLNQNKEKIIQEIETVKEEDNIIEDLSYISIDAKGNEYILKAEYGKERLINPNVIILEKVVGTIKLKNKSDIIINSDFAKYNSITYDTNFYQNVHGFFEKNKIYSDNLDLFIKNNEAIMYNNIKYLNEDTLANADEIKFNLLTGDINIKMFDKNKKVQIIKN